MLIIHVSKHWKHETFVDCSTIEYCAKLEHNFLFTVWKFYLSLKLVLFRFSWKIAYSSVNIQTISSRHSAVLSLAAIFSARCYEVSSVIHSKMQIFVNEEKKERDRWKIKPGKCQFLRQIWNLISTNRAAEYRPAARETNLRFISWREVASAESDFFLSLSFFLDLSSSLFLSFSFFSQNISYTFP